MRDTEGAQLHGALDSSETDEIVDKGDQRGVDGYSAFDGTDFERGLRDRAIDALTIGGLATNICVRWTALDARRLGFDVTVAIDATRGVDLEPGDTEYALDEMREAGGRLMSTAQLAGEPGLC